jgi:hypothetical protein
VENSKIIRNTNQDDMHGETMYFTASEEHGGKYIDPINVGSRIKQGCVMSPTLLFIVIDSNRQQIRNNIDIPNKLENTEFADDVCLLTEKRYHMERELQKLKDESKRQGN